MPLISAAGYPTQTEPTVQPAATPGPDYQSIPAATPNAFGAQIGAAQERLGGAFEQAGTGLAEEAIRRQQLTNQVAANQATNYTMDEVTKILHGDPNIPGDVGFYGKKGIDAVNARQSTAKSLDDIITKTRGTLSNPRQQLSFDNETRRMRNYWMGEIGRHYDQQLTQSAINSAVAGQKMGYQGMASTAANQDNEGFSLQVENTMKRVYDQAKAGGWTQDQIDEKLGEVRSDATKIWVSSVGEKDPAGALRLLESNKDALRPGEYPALVDHLRSRAQKQVTHQDVYGGTQTPHGLVRGGAVQGRISQEAQQASLDPNFVNAVADIESSGGRNLGRRGNIFQLGDTEWASVGGGTKGDPETDIKNGVAFLAEKKKELSLHLGRDPTPAEIYLAHQQGTAGALKLITNPNTPAGELVPPRNISGNGGDPNAPASAFVGKWANAINRRMNVTPQGSPDTVAPTQTGATVTPIAAREDQLIAAIPHDDGQLPDAQVPGLMGAISEAFKKIGNDPGPYTSVEERKAAAVKQLRSQMNAAYADQRHQHTLDQEAIKQADQSLMMEYNKRLGSPNPPTALDVLNDPRWKTPEAQQKMVGFVERETKQDPAAQVSKRNTVDLFERMKRPWGTEGKLTSEDEIDKSYINGQLTRQDHDDLVKKWRDIQTDTGQKIAVQEAELTKALTARITGAIEMRPEAEAQMEEQSKLTGVPTAKMRMYSFVDNMHRKVEAYRAANKDPSDLFNPKKPDFLGSPDAIAPFEAKMPTKMTEGSPVNTKHITQMTSTELRAFAGQNAANWDAARAEIIRRGVLVQPAVPQAPIR